MNTGVRKGIGAQLKSQRKYIIIFHCAAHRLELVVKDAFKNCVHYKNLHLLMDSLNRFYYYLPSNYRGLQAAAETKGKLRFLHVSMVQGGLHLF